MEGMITESATTPEEDPTATSEAVPKDEKAKGKKNKKNVKIAIEVPLEPEEEVPAEPAPAAEGDDTAKEDPIAIEQLLKR
jgi:hypothetical protein